MLQVVLLKGGMITPADYSDESPWVTDPRVDTLRAKIDMVEDEQLTADYYNVEKRSSANALFLTLADGSKLDEVLVEYPPGHPWRDDTPTFVKHKFEANVRGYFDQQRAVEIARLTKIEVDQLMLMEVRDFVDTFAGDDRIGTIPNQPHRCEKNPAGLTENAPQDAIESAIAGQMAKDSEEQCTASDNHTEAHSSSGFQASTPKAFSAASTASDNDTSTETDFESTSQQEASSSKFPTSITRTPTPVRSVPKFSQKSAKGKQAGREAADAGAFYDSGHYPPLGMNPDENPVEATYKRGDWREKLYIDQRLPKTLIADADVAVAQNGSVHFTDGEIYLAAFPPNKSPHPSPHISYGLPFPEACAKHIAETFHATQVYILASTSLSRNTNDLSKLHAAIDGRLGEGTVVGIRQGVKPHSYYSDILKITKEARDWNTNCLVTLGGGSLADAAKIVALVSPGLPFSKILAPSRLSIH